MTDTPTPSYVLIDPDNTDTITTLATLIGANIQRPGSTTSRDVYDALIKYVETNRHTPDRQTERIDALETALGAAWDYIHALLGEIEATKMYDDAVKVTSEMSANARNAHDYAASKGDIQ